MVVEDVETTKRYTSTSAIDIRRNSTSGGGGSQHSSSYTSRSPHSNGGSRFALETTPEEFSGYLKELCSPRRGPEDTIMNLLGLSSSLGKNSNASTTTPKQSNNIRTSNNSSRFEFEIEDELEMQSFQMLNNDDDNDYESVKLAQQLEEQEHTDRLALVLAREEEDKKLVLEMLEKERLQSIQADTSKDLITQCVQCDKDDMSIEDIVFLDFARYDAASLEEVISKNKGTYVNCPNCQMCMEKIVNVDSSPSGKEFDSNGNELSKKAVEHKKNHRLRCPECQTIFCTDCFVTPYHVGYTCSEFLAYSKSRHSLTNARQSSPMPVKRLLLVGTIVVALQEKQSVFLV
eukprot:gene13675-16104_t